MRLSVMSTREKPLFIKRIFSIEHFYEIWRSYGTSVIFTLHKCNVAICAYFTGREIYDIPHKFDKNLSKSGKSALAHILQKNRKKLACMPCLSMCVCALEDQCQVKVLHLHSHVKLTSLHAMHTMHAARKSVKNACAHAKLSINQHFFTKKYVKYKLLSS